MLERVVVIPANFSSQISSTTNPDGEEEAKSQCMFCVFWRRSFNRVFIFECEIDRRWSPLSDLTVSCLESKFCFVCSICSWELDNSISLCVRSLALSEESAVHTVACDGAHYHRQPVRLAVTRDISTFNLRLARLFNVSLSSVLLNSNKSGTKCSSDESTWTD